jgi:hypothetical protein
MIDNLASSSGKSGSKSRAVDRLSRVRFCVAFLSPMYLKMGEGYFLSHSLSFLVVYHLMNRAYLLKHC